MTAIIESKPTSRLPIYFLSHGGPTFLIKDEFGGNIGAFKTIQSIGNTIKTKLKPKFIICVTGHWESNSPDLIEVGIPDQSTLYSIDDNSIQRANHITPGIQFSDKRYQKFKSEEHSLIYDFYGFPEEMYQHRFHVNGSIELSEKIHKDLKNAGIDTKITKRGLDHGVWVPLKIAFTPTEPPKDLLPIDSQKLDIDVPLVQISLAKTEDFDIHYKLGQVLGSLRDEGGLIFVSGSSVHNLRDMGKSSSQLGYPKVFNELLTELVTKHEGEESLNEFKKLKQTNPKLLYSAHPTLDHLMPIVVGVGAAKNTKAKPLFEAEVSSLGWNIYEWD